MDPLFVLLMNIQSLISEIKMKVGQEGDVSNFIAAEALLCFVLGKNKSFLISHAEFVLSEKQEKIFFELFSRLLKGEPLAYLINKKEFYGLEFFVDKRVLIPRPETELLVDTAIKCVKDYNKPRILDLGTGSGCIAVAIAVNLLNAKITAVDLHKEALQVAAINAYAQGVGARVTFVQSDLLQNLNEDFDLIVANLPYIGTKRFAFVNRESTEYEPHSALFGGEDGLRLYEGLFKQINQRGKLPKFLLGEFGFLQGQEVRALIKRYFPANQLEILEDYAKIERIFMVKF